MLWSHGATFHIACPQSKRGERQSLLPTEQSSVFSNGEGVGCINAVSKVNLFQPGWVTVVVYAERITRGQYC